MDTKPATKKLGIVIILVMSFCSFMISVSSLYAVQLNNSLITKSENIDIRFVVDVSTAMKKHDPARNRVRALQKVIKSLPNNAVSGIWTYGKFVNMLVPLGPTTEQWKKQAVYSLDTIGGYGDYRNLGLALEKATYGWQNKSDVNKYIVVLTGGDLRVSSSKTKNAKAQLKLLTQTLAKLKKADIEVHTLSFGDKIDDRLLKVIANHTNGNWYKVSSAATISNVLGHVYNVIAANNHNQIAKQYAHNAKKIVDKNIKHKIVAKKQEDKSTKVVAAKQKKLNLKYKKDESTEFNWPDITAG